MSERGYWEQYYEEQSDQPKLPSPFAAFVLNEFNNYNQFVDIGCGNGRDSIFFSKYVDQVLGVDYSKQAILNARNRSEASDLNIKFGTIDFSKPTAIDELNNLLDGWSGKKIIYSRFFLHAISEESEDIFLSACNEIMSENDFLCLEFRNKKDKNNDRVTPEHYRRYINTENFIRRAKNKAFKIEYQVSGNGMAKYKYDDASVSRVILR